MASPNVRNILRLPGRLVAAPTNLLAAYPHGGVELGVVRDVEFRPGIKASLVTAEEYGGVVTEAIYAGEAPILACVLRSFDNDLIERLFLNTSVPVVSGASGDRIILGRASGAGVNRAGTLRDASAIVLLFTPKNVDMHPMVLIRRAIPMVEETAALALSLSQELGLGLVFYCAPDSSGRTYDVGKRQDLTL